MLEMTRWDPARAMTAARDPFHRLFEQFLGRDLLRPGLLPAEGGPRQWMPPVDIRETDDRYEVFAELPGLSKKDIDISLEENVLTLSGERKFEAQAERDNYHRVERAFGTFSRSFSFPSRVDAGRVSASFKDGVLTIAVPKAEEAKPRKIAIR